uniref:Transcription factor E2F6 n=2 Tax=Lygus hesperus TaxID=30085 RepID=A0A0A9W2E2_LYGHE
MNMDLDHRHLSDLEILWNADKSSKGGSRSNHELNKSRLVSNYTPPLTPRHSKDLKRSRADRNTSLGNLTHQFMRLLMKAPGWQLDMNEAAVALGGSKRRLYDVTGVLLGANLVTKPQKNIIAWTGFETVDEYRNTSLEISALLDTEKRIDGDIQYMKRILDKMRTLDELYLTKEDVAPLYTNKTVMFVRGPSDTILLVPKESDSFMFTLKTPNDPIDVFLFSDDDEENEMTEDISPDAKSNKVEYLKSVSTRRSFKAEYSGIPHFSDYKILLRGLYPGPFQESELAPRKTKKHVVNFIPLEPTNNQSKPPIASYRAESAAFRCPPLKKMRIS